MSKRGSEHKKAGEARVISRVARDYLAKVREERGEAVARALTPRIARLRDPITWESCVEQFELMIEDDANAKAEADEAADIRFDS